MNNEPVLLSPTQVGGKFLILNHTVLLVSKFPTFNSGGLKDVQDSWMIIPQSWVNSWRPYPLPFPFFRMGSPLVFSSWRTCMNPASSPVSSLAEFYSSSTCLLSTPKWKVFPLNFFTPWAAIFEFSFPFSFGQKRKINAPKDCCESSGEQRSHIQIMTLKQSPATLTQFCSIFSLSF